MEKAVYHFVGIKGTGMSALALILKDLGYQVQGSDITKKHLQRQAYAGRKFLYWNLPPQTFSPQ